MNGKGHCSSRKLLVVSAESFLIDFQKTEQKRIKQPGAQPLRGRWGGGARKNQTPNQKSSRNFSFIHQRYCFLRLFRNFTVFTEQTTIFGQLMATFTFSNYIGEQIILRGEIFNAGPSEKFLFVDHPKSITIKSV